MAIYITKRCSNCDYEIQPRRTSTGLNMGNPFIKCPNCGALQLDGEKKEFVMWGTSDYLAYFGPQLLVSWVIGFLVGGLIWGLIDDTNKLLLWIPSLLIMAGYMYLIYKGFLEEKEASIQRTKKREYLDEIYKYNLITKEKYDEFIAKYMR